MKHTLLKETFIELTKNYTENTQLTIDMWNEIEVNYSGKKRHYHTLEHLENLLEQLSEIKDQIKEWNTVLFTLYYHDIIYNPLKNNNEEESSGLAEIRMKSISIPQQIIENCKTQILATKKHLASADNDTNCFTDADLSILGQNWNNYTNYAKNVRKEYSIYPALVYNSGRKKVLEHFLKMERIFKTIYFFEKFELQAKQNLQKELDAL